MSYEIGNKQNKNFLDGIEEIDKDTELASKKNSEKDLSWLETATNEKQENFLEGIERLEVGSSIESYTDRGILEVINKQKNWIPLEQYEIKMLRDFKLDFPDITKRDLEEAANIWESARRKNDERE